jgi:hypothetical protein
MLRTLLVSQGLTLSCTPQGSVFGKTFGTMEVDVTGGWGKLPNRLRSLNLPLHFIRVIRQRTAVMGMKGRLTDTTTIENCALLGYNETTGCLETSARNHYYSLSNNPEERSSSISWRQPEVTLTTTTAYRGSAEKNE